MVKWKKKAGKADSSHSRTQFQGLQVKGRKCVDKSVIICEGESGSVICFNELTSATYSYGYILDFARMSPLKSLFQTSNSLSTSSQAPAHLLK